MAAKNEIKQRIPVISATIPTAFIPASLSIKALMQSVVGGPAETSLAYPKTGALQIPEHLRDFSSFGKNYPFGPFNSVNALQAALPLNLKDLQLPKYLVIPGPLRH